MTSLQEQILAYQPYNQNEQSDKALILQCMESFPDVLTRQNLICHFTSSSWIVNPAHTKALLIYHNIEQTWMWTGGHADGESNMFDVALREAKEETSLNSLRALSKDFFSLEVFAVPPHIRRGEFVSAHLHLNCGFLLEADENEAFKIKSDENSGIRWADFSEIIAKSQKGTMSPHYASLIERLEKLGY